MLLSPPQPAQDADAALVWATQREYALRAKRLPVDTCWCWTDYELRARGFYCPACSAEMEASDDE